MFFDAAAAVSIEQPIWPAVDDAGPVEVAGVANGAASLIEKSQLDPLRVISNCTHVPDPTATDEFVAVKLVTFVTALQLALAEFRNDI